MELDERDGKGKLKWVENSSEWNFIFRFDFVRFEVSLVFQLHFFPLLSHFAFPSPLGVVLVPAETLYFSFRNHYNIVSGDLSIWLIY